MLGNSNQTAEPEAPSVRAGRFTGHLKSTVFQTVSFLTPQRPMKVSKSVGSFGRFGG